jgi:hypothetical protein
MPPRLHKHLSASQKLEIAYRTEPVDCQPSRPCKQAEPPAIACDDHAESLVHPVRHRLGDLRPAIHQADLRPMAILCERIR